MGLTLTTTWILLAVSAFHRFLCTRSRSSESEREVAERVRRGLAWLIRDARDLLLMSVREEDASARERTSERRPPRS